jgi:hypothetical protein
MESLVPVVRVGKCFFRGNSGSVSIFSVCVRHVPDHVDSNMSPQRQGNSLESSSDLTVVLQENRVEPRE